MNTMKRKTALLLTGLFVIMCALIFGSAKNKKEQHVMELSEGQYLAIPQDTSFVQTFFPLADNIESLDIYLDSATANVLDVKIFDPYSDVVYFNGEIGIESSGWYTVPFREAITNGYNHEYYLLLKSKVVSGSSEIRIGMADSEFKDNHLLIAGQELSEDIALSIKIKSAVSVKDFIGIILLGILLLTGILVDNFFENSNKGNIKPATCLELYRMLAALLILVLHIGDGIPISDSIRKYTVFWGHGVDLFYVLSGYLIFHSLAKDKNLLKFYVKRFFRIVPVYYAVIIIVWLYMTLGHIPWDFDSSGLYWGRYFTFLSTSLPSSSNFWINLCATWTVSGFLLFYLLAPFAGKYIDSYKKAIYLTIALYIFGEFFLVGKIGELVGSWGWERSFIEYHPARFLWIFSFGISTYWAIKEDRKGKFIVLCVFFVLLSLTGFVANSRLPFSALFAIVILINYNTEIKNKVLAKLVNMLSQYSYTLYLVHPVLLIIFFNYYKYFENNFYYGTALLISIIICTYCMYVMIEKPFLNISKRIIKLLHD